MYAIIATGGKQYRVREGDYIRVEKLVGDPGEKVEFDQVLLMADEDHVEVGTPYVQGGSVTGEVEQQARARKVDVIKFKRRKHHMKRMGHRQSFTQVRITGISK